MHAGANAAGIDSVFIAGGIHAEELSVSAAQLKPEEARLHELIKEHNATPQYCMAFLQWRSCNWAHGLEFLSLHDLDLLDGPRSSVKGNLSIPGYHSLHWFSSSFLLDLSAFQFSAQYWAVLEECWIMLISSVTSALTSFAYVAAIVGALITIYPALPFKLNSTISVQIVLQLQIYISALFGCHSMDTYLTVGSAVGVFLNHVYDTMQEMSIAKFCHTILNLHHEWSSSSKICLLHWWSMPAIKGKSNESWEQNYLLQIGPEPTRTHFKKKRKITVAFSARSLKQEGI